MCVLMSVMTCDLYVCRQGSKCVQMSVMTCDLYVCRQGSKLVCIEVCPDWLGRAACAMQCEFTNKDLLAPHKI